MNDLKKSGDNFIGMYYSTHKTVVYWLSKKTKQSQQNSILECNELSASNWVLPKPVKAHYRLWFNSIILVNYSISTT